MSIDQPAAPASDPGQPDQITPEPISLREPAHRVSPRAVSYWRLLNAISLTAALVVFVAVWLLWDGAWWWLLALLGAWVVTDVVSLAVVPVFKFRVHRWEVDDLAVHTRSGWLNVETRIAPLSRVQTVESQQGVIMRRFRLASLTVTTASAAGPITIEGLDQDEARELVARLTAITGADSGDAT